jgi:hypothetical protein
MKRVPKYSKGGEEVLAYEKADLDPLVDFFKGLESLWFEEWSRQGAKDEGSCTLGKGFYVYAVGPRQRVARPVKVVGFHVQGNVAAQKTKHVVESILGRVGISAYYDDGRMD